MTPSPPSADSITSNNGTNTESTSLNLRGLQPIQPVMGLPLPSVVWPRRRREQEMRRPSRLLFSLKTPDRSRAPIQSPIQTPIQSLIQAPCWFRLCCRAGGGSGCAVLLIVSERWRGSLWIGARCVRRPRLRWVVALTGSMMRVRVSYSAIVVGNA